MTGIVIAPGATINIRSNLNGTIVAENINVYAESHRTDFTGTVVEPEDGKQPHQITIQKHETGYVANTVPGAEFKLYEYDGVKNTWVQIDDDAKQSTKILVTDSNGVIQLGGLKASVAYKLEEIKAPSGYIKSETPFYFWIKAASTDAKPSKPADFSGSMISPGNTLFVPNDKNNSTTTSLQLEKIWKRSDGTVITGNDIPVNSITVNIYQLVNGNKLIDVYQTVMLSRENNWTVMLDNLPLKGRDANGNEVAYTYEVEENLTLNGYTVTYTETGTKITITNTAAGYELPETGGSGTQVYILTGMMLILASIVLLYNQSRHRRGNV
jgi:LPXTG-motif cell wall-anchored protein